MEDHLRYLEARNTPLSLNKEEEEEEEERRSGFCKDNRACNRRRKT